MGDKWSNVGGVAGSLLAMLLKINISQIVEVGMYAGVGAATGEIVKFLSRYIKARIASYRSKRKGK